MPGWILAIACLITMGIAGGAGYLISGDAQAVFPASIGGFLGFWIMQIYRG